MFIESSVDVSRSLESSGFTRCCMSERSVRAYRSSMENMAKCTVAVHFQLGARCKHCGERCDKRDSRDLQ